MGYERPAYFINHDVNSDLVVDSSGHRILETPTLGKPFWFDTVRSEYEACRHRVGKFINEVRSK